MNDKTQEMLTSYVLGELNDQQRAEVEELVENDTEAKELLAKIKDVAGQVTEHYRTEEPPQVTRKPARIQLPEQDGRRGTFSRWIVTATAASILIFTGVIAYTMFTRDENDNGYSYTQENLREQPSYKVYTPAPEYSKTPAAESRKSVSPSSDQLSITGIAGGASGNGISAPRLSPTPNRISITDGEELLPGDMDREGYSHITENQFRTVKDHPLSTFSIDVDTASYSNVRRIINSGQLPPAGAVRIEEMINYFDYDYTGPSENQEHPFRTHLAATRCPWNTKHHLVRIALRGRQIKPEKRPAGNIVFLLDVSGSMSSHDKLPLLKQGMKMLVNNLNSGDRVAIAVYAGSSGLVLDSTSCDDKQRIIDALDRLNAGGSTNGGAGIKLAYNVATKHFITGGINRVILCTDGDFNVGQTSDSELVDLITDRAKSGVFLTVLGFGTGNYQDAKMEQLADKGNGNFGYIDTIHEAKKMLVDQLGATLVTIAKDVKIQVEFNPAKVSAYRLIGYENRMLKKEDFNDDKKDAGEIGAGHTVTALYEVVPSDIEVPGRVDPLKYQPSADPREEPKNEVPPVYSDEMLTVKLRYKKPDGDVSTLLQQVLRDTEGRSIRDMDNDFRFAASVAAFGMILRKSEYVGDYTLDAVIEAAAAAKGTDRHGYRAEFVRLAELVRDISGR